MKPNVLRYIRNEQDVWSFLWRIMPRAVRELHATKQLNKQNYGKTIPTTNNPSTQR